MKDEASIHPAFVVSVVVACGLLVGALVLSRVDRNGPSAVADSAPAAAAPVAAIRAVTETETEARTLPDAPPVRPETALLQELPKAQLARAPDSPLSDLRVSFKLESRLTRSLYMGDRWLSPATYLQVGAGDDCTIEASIRGLDAEGNAVKTPATWRVADPEMVSVSAPGPGNTVKLTVVRPGETTVEITAEGISKQLPLHAKSYGGTLLVAMGQE